MMIVFTFNRLAVSVRRWFEVTPEAVMEHGSRVELSLLTPQAHRGTDSAAQRTVIDQAFWRADLFNRLDRPSGSFSAAHFHPRFNGVEPCDRVWSRALTASPWTWLADQLQNVEERLAEAELDADIAGNDADDLRTFVPQIVATARQFSPESLMSRDEDYHLTRDAVGRVRRMLAHIPGHLRVDREYLEPWIEQR